MFCTHIKPFHNLNEPRSFLCTAPCHIQSPGLPDGWVSIQHASGGTVYFHRESRVCTWGMPYIIKKGVTVKVRLTMYQCSEATMHMHTSNCGTYVCVLCPIGGHVCTVYKCTYRFIGVCIITY